VATPPSLLSFPFVLTNHPTSFELAETNGAEKEMEQWPKAHELLM